MNSVQVQAEMRTLDLLWLMPSLGIPRQAAMKLSAFPLLLSRKLDLPDYASCLPQFGGS